MLGIPLWKDRGTKQHTPSEFDLLCSGLLLEGKWEDRLLPAHDRNAVCIQGVKPCSSSDPVCIGGCLPLWDDSGFDCTVSSYKPQIHITREQIYSLHHDSITRAGSLWLPGRTALCDCLHTVRTETRSLYVIRTVSQLHYIADDSAERRCANSRIRA